jgi:hypothetical protein
MENTAEAIPQKGQQPQLSKEDYAAKMKADRESLSELANSTGAEIAADGGKFSSI